MQTSYALPDGTTRTVTALTAQEVTVFAQNLTLSLLGIPLPSPTSTPAQMDAVYRRVRVNWQPQSQPTWRIGEDVTFLQVVPATDDLRLLRDQVCHLDGGATGTVSIRQQYAQQWQVSWNFYGPNSQAASLSVHAGLLSDWALGQMRAAGLSIQTGFALPARRPEEVNQQTWERSDLEVLLNSSIVTVTTAGRVTTVPIEIIAQGVGLAPSLYGSGGWGTGGFGAVQGESELITYEQAGPVENT